MYWYKTKGGVFIALLAIAACLSSCKPDIKETGAALRYFDIKGYFAGDIPRLNRLNKRVFKTVSHNGKTESETVTINNWDRELDLFIGSDINKPAWNNSYSIVASDNFLLYKAKYPELKTREMLIKKDKQQVKWILIFNHTKNMLYETSEKLSYYPDSLYLIEKKQKVRLIGVNTYVIKGLMKR